MEEAVQYDVVVQHQPNCCRPSASAGLPCQDESCNSCNSTPFVSAPSSPRKTTPFAYYFARATLTLSASSQTHDVADYDGVSTYAETEGTAPSSPSLSDFDFRSRFSEADASLNPSRVAPPMSTAEELFHNGKIRPLNTRLCSGSYCLCFSNAVLDDGYSDPHFHDACSRHAYTGGPPSPLGHSQHHHQHREQQQSFMKNHTKPTSTLSALEQWKRSMGRYDKGRTRHAHGHNIERVMQIPSLPIARSRNSGREGGHHSRTRSLSPLRVFHMEEKMNMQARASFEREIHSNTHAVDGATIMKPRRSRRSWTLKELLYMGDNRVHAKRPQRPAGSGSTESTEFRSKSANEGRIDQEIESSSKIAKSVVAKRSLEGEALHSKASTRNEAGARSPCNLQEAVQEEHASQYYSTGFEERQVEKTKDRNFLPYKKTLLGCLGFTSKLNSMKLHAMKG